MADSNEQSSSASGLEALWAGGLGLAQITAGVALQTYSAGFLYHAGVLLIRLGSSDIAYAVRTGVNGTFSWREYRREKRRDLPFSAASVVAEGSLSVSQKFEGSIVGKTATKAFMAAGRGGVNVALGEILKKVKGCILENFQERFEVEIKSKFSQEFVNIREDVEELFRLNPANAERMIWEAFEDVLKKADEYDQDLGPDVVRRLSSLCMELILLYQSEKGKLSEGNAVVIKFMGLSALSAADCFVFARQLLTSLHEALITLRRQNQALDLQAQAPPAADAVYVEGFAARFKKGVKTTVVNKVSERVRRGLLQASVQSFILALMS